MKTLSIPLVHGLLSLFLRKMQAFHHVTPEDDQFTRGKFEYLSLNIMDVTHDKL